MATGIAPPCSGRTTATASASDRVSGDMMAGGAPAKLAADAAVQTGQWCATVTGRPAASSVIVTTPAPAHTTTSVAPAICPRATAAVTEVNDSITARQKAKHPRSIMATVLSHRRACRKRTNPRKRKPRHGDTGRGQSSQSKADQAFA